MTQAEKICANVSADIKPQAVTLANAVLAMQEKIEQQIPLYDDMSFTQKLRTTQGEIALRQNPAVAEFRATVRDYANALKSLQNIVENNQAPEQKTNLAAFRSKLKVV